MTKFWIIDILYKNVFVTILSHTLDKLSIYVYVFALVPRKAYNQILKKKKWQSYNCSIMIIIMIIYHDIYIYIYILLKYYDIVQIV